MHYSRMQCQMRRQVCGCMVYRTHADMHLRMQWQAALIGGVCGCSDTSHLLVYVTVWSEATCRQGGRWVLRPRRPPASI